MDTVLVTGGTGHLGREVVRLLKSAYRVRVLARSPGPAADVEWIKGDLATGEGVPEAVEGVRIVVHAATLSPAARRGYIQPSDFWRSPPDVDVDGTTRLLDESARVGVEHFAYVSIVGIDRPRGAYLRLKHTAEELISSEDVPWSILRATQFFWLLDRMLGKVARLPALPVPAKLISQPVDAADFASYVVECVGAGPSCRRTDFGGPEVLSLDALVEQWQRVRGCARRVVKVPVPTRMARAAVDMTCPAGRRGTTRWAEWLSTHAAERS